MAKKPPPNGDNGEKHVSTNGNEVTKDNVTNLQDHQKLNKHLDETVSEKHRAAGEEAAREVMKEIGIGYDDEQKKVAEKFGQKLGEAFGKMIAAEERGEDLELDDLIDLDEFNPNVIDTVGNAINAYSAEKDVDLSQGLVSQFNKVEMLFHPKRVLESNEMYRAMTREGHYHFVSNEGLFASELFSQHRGYRGIINEDEVEKALRRVDSEARTLDPIQHDDLIYNFVNAILSSSFGSYNAVVTTDDFTMLSEEARGLIRDLIMLYADVRDISHALDKGRGRWGSAKFDDDTLDDLIHAAGVRDYPARAEYAHITRQIRPPQYYRINALTRALAGALPNKVVHTVDAVLKQEGLTCDPGSLSIRLVAPSKNMRNALIAISQGFGSFQAFFTALNEYQKVLEEELNNRVAAARKLVALYDTLGLDIARTLEASRRRILGDSPFD